MLNTTVSFDHEDESEVIIMSTDTDVFFRWPSNCTISSLLNYYYAELDSALGTSGKELSRTKDKVTLHLHLAKIENNMLSSFSSLQLFVPQASCPCASSPSKLTPVPPSKPSQLSSSLEKVIARNLSYFCPLDFG